MKVATEQIGSERIEIDVDGAGIFRANYDDAEYAAKTLGELKALLEQAAKRTREQKAVPVTIINLVPRDEKANYRYSRSGGWYEEGRGVVHAKLRGRHHRESAWLLTSEDGKKFQVSGNRGDRENICRRLTDDEVEEYMRLAAAVDLAEQALEAFRKRVHKSPEDLLGLKL